MASQELGPLGPHHGPAVMVDCPVSDALRSVIGWLGLLLLLCFRKTNRARKAWALWIPPLILWSVLSVAEGLLNSYLVFHYHQYICSALADLLRFFSLSLAILLTVGDKMVLPSRPLRVVLVSLVLFLATNAQIALNQWAFLKTGTWAFFFAITLGVFLVGHTVLTAILERAVRPTRFPGWYAGFCLLLGLVPCLVLGILELYLSQSVQLQSTREHFRVAVVLGAALSLPWLVHFAFVVLAISSHFYRDRLARAFGLQSLTLAPANPIGQLPSLARP